MVALTRVEPACGQRWLVHLCLSGVFSVLAVWRNWQNTRHGRLWRCPNGARCAFQHARKRRQPWRTGGARRAAGGGAHRRKTKPCCRQLAWQNWPTFARVAPPARRHRQMVGRRQVAAGGACGVVVVSLACGIHRLAAPRARLGHLPEEDFGPGTCHGLRGVDNSQQVKR